MHILIAAVCEFPEGPGATPRLLRMQAKGFVSLGHTVMVAVPIGTWNGGRRARIDGYETICFGHRSSHGRRLWTTCNWVKSRALYCLYLSYLSLFRGYDLLLLNGASAEFALIGPLARLMGRKVYCVFGDLLALYESMSLQTTAKRAISIVTNAFMARTASMLIIAGTSVLQKRYYRLAPRTPQVRTWAATDTEMFAAGKPEVAIAKYGLQGQKAVVYSGSVNSLEGVPILIEAMRIVAREIPNTTLVIAGRWYDEDPVSGKYIDFKALAREADIEDNVIFTGHLLTEEIINLLSAADVLVMAKIDHALNRVASPIKMAEYLASGRPVISSRICELDTVLRHREDVLFVEPGNIEALATAICQVLCDSDLSKKLSQNGALAAKRIFDARAWAKKVLQSTAATNT